MLADPPVPPSGSDAGARERDDRPVPPWLRTAGRLLAAAVAGVVLEGAFPALDLWFLAPLSVAALTLLTRGVRPRRGALLGFVFGLGFFVPHLQWSGIYVGELPWFALATVESAYLAGLGALLPFAWRLRGGPAVHALCVAGLWVLQEAVRGRWPFGGFPWGDRKSVV